MSPYKTRVTKEPLPEMEHRSLKDVKLHPLLAGDALINKQQDSKQNKKNPYLQHLKQPAKPEAKPTFPHVIKRHEARPNPDAELDDLMRQVEDGGLEEPALMVKLDTVRWWDTCFINQQTGLVCYDSIDNTIVDPPPCPLPLALVEQLLATPKPLHLTESERKKLRRERRLQEQRDKQEKIRLGLLPPEKPKNKLANLITTATKDLSQAGAISEPTLRELKVKAEVEARRQEHDKRNAERALDAVGKRDKLLKKYRPDLTEGSVSSLLVKFDFNLLDEKAKFKLTVNARQNHLFGILCLFHEKCFAYVEGDASGIKRYKHLCKSRMNIQACTVHEGVSLRPSFDTFTVYTDSEFDAKRTLIAAGCEDVWRMLLG